MIAGPYPASMIGMPGLPSNMAPPSAVMLAVFAGQLGLALWAREWLNRLLPAPVLSWLAPRMMTFYLWHMTALITVGGVAFVGFGAETPQPWSGTWWMLLPHLAGLAGAGPDRAHGPVRPVRGGPADEFDPAPDAHGRRACRPPGCSP